MPAEAAGSYLNSSGRVTGTVITQRGSDPGCHLLFLMQIRACCLSEELRAAAGQR